MIARIASLLALLAILIPAAALAQPEDQRSGKDSRGADSLQVIAPAVEIDFCQLRPRYEVYFTKADFTATFSFEVGADGAPKNFVDRTHITREDALRWGWPERFVGPGTPTSKWMLWQADEAFSLVCISSWRLRGIPVGTKIMAEFKWKQNFGWESLHIVGEGINYTIKASGLRENTGG
jgi:hypothetical protein